MVETRCETAREAVLEQQLAAARAALREFLVALHDMERWNPLPDSLRKARRSARAAL